MTGLIIVHTGDGKGKTTAALGMALRIVGHGSHVVMVQFLKKETDTGEILAARKFIPALSIEPMGEGFLLTNDPEVVAVHTEAARRAMKRCIEVMQANEAAMLIMDEINYAVDMGLLDPSAVIDALRRYKPAGMHIVLTGRAARAELVDMADLVTEMKCVKHPYEAGIKAQKGIEF